MLVFRLGAESSIAAVPLATRTSGTAVAQAALEQVRQFWVRTLGAVQVSTPNRAIDIMTNGWLI